MKLRFILLLFVTLFLSFRFSEELVNVIEQQIDLPNTSFNYTNISIPTHLSTNVLNGPLQNAATDNDNTPATNATTDDGATLGRVLFYDKNLSANQTVACAACHQQENGFSDSKVLSIGFDGGTTRRHSMGLTNAVWYDRGRFFWDERAATLEEQVLMPFQDPVEMGMTLDGVVSAVESQAFYPELFEKAFGSETVNADRISKALSQFIRSMVSVSSKYDIGRQEVSRPTTSFSNFTDSENRGKRLFFLPQSNGGLSCVGCHSTEAFINPDAGATNNGLDIASTDDLGVFEAIPNNAFLGTFKVPSLKNIELTAPYMHDGRFATLEEVVEHYNSGVQDHPNLNSSLKDENGNPQRLNLSEQDKEDVVNFLKTLTDKTLVNDVKFSDPFIINSIVDNDNDGFDVNNDCDDNNASIHPDATEILDNDVDENCDGIAAVSSVIDNDNDGFDVDNDCDDNNPNIHPDATEILDNDIDENCDGIAAVSPTIDNDNDGFDVDSDCDDNNANINPAATDIPDNGVDENCDGMDETTTNSTACSAPIDIIAATINQRRTAIEWSPVENARNYEVQVRLKGEADWTIENTTRRTSMTIVSLSATYEVRIRTNCVGGDVSAYSEIIEFLSSSSLQSGESRSSDLQEVDLIIPDYLVNKEFQISPNPFSNLLQLNYVSEGETYLSIFHLSGKLVWQQKLSIGQTYHSIDCSSFEAGLYTILIQEKGQQPINQKIVKIKN